MLFSYQQKKNVGSRFLFIYLLLIFLKALKYEHSLARFCLSRQATFMLSGLD